MPACWPCFLLLAFFSLNIIEGIVRLFEFGGATILNFLIRYNKLENVSLKFKKNLRSNEPRLAPQLKWPDNIFNTQFLLSFSSLLSTVAIH
jgi:hypothetical protein